MKELALTRLAVNKIRFEPSTHSYWTQGGKRLPSVTEIIKQAGLMPCYEYATTQFGDDVHKAVEKFELQDHQYGDFMADLERKTDHCYEEEVAHSVSAWILFCGESLKGKYEPIGTECRMADTGFGFAGTLDGLYWNPDIKRFLVVERKTGGSAPWHRIQTAGYKLLASVNQEEAKVAPVDRVAVYLSINGTYRAEWHDHPLQKCRDKDTFLAALACAQWRIRNGMFWDTKKEI